MKTRYSIISFLTVIFVISILFVSCQKEKIESPKKSVPTIALQSGTAILDGTVTTPNPEPR